MEKEYTRICKICGKEFTTPHPTKLICRMECKMENNRRMTTKYRNANLEEIRQRERDNAAKRKLKKIVDGKKSHMTIDDICKAARENGMSYGEYVAAKSLGKI